MKSPATAREDGGSRARLKSTNEVAGTTLAEEKKTDETLTQLAESQVNQHAQAA
jgi:ferritin-like metal-binding protein YciE